MPFITATSVCGMVAGVFASIIESIGDYYACAKISGAPPPPKHAVCRGVGCEGIGCLLNGLLGTANGTTSLSENIAAIGVTRVCLNLDGLFYTVTFLLRIHVSGWQKIRHFTGTRKMAPQLHSVHPMLRQPLQLPTLLPHKHASRLPTPHT